jgi:hypothetical protein
MVTFVAAAVDGVKWSKDMREQLKTMQRDVNAMTDHASYLSNKVAFVLNTMLASSIFRGGKDAKPLSISPVKFECWAERLSQNFLQ